MKKLYYAFIAATLCTLLLSCKNTKAPVSEKIVYTEPEAIDMGLSVKWANCNLGADTPEGFGVYLAWGETEMKAGYSEDNYKWYSTPFNKTKYNWDESKGVVDSLYLLTPEDDAAIVYLGQPWRIPNHQDWEELAMNSDWEWTERNGVPGMEVTSKINGNQLFFPAAGGFQGKKVEDKMKMGGYWTSELADSGPEWPYCLLFGNYWLEMSASMYCFWGFSIRPVQ